MAKATEFTGGTSLSAKKRVPGVVRTQLASWLFVGAHLAALAVAYAFAFAVRFDFDVPPHYQVLLTQSLPFVVGLKLFVFYVLGISKSGGRGARFDDLLALGRAAIISLIVIAFIDYGFLLHEQIPRGVLAIDCGASILLIGGIRASWRLGVERIWPSLTMNRRTPVLLIGKSPDSEYVIREIHQNEHLNFRIVGFLQDHPTAAKKMEGVRCLGWPRDVVEVAKRRRVQQILLVSGSISGRRLRKLVQRCRQAKIELKVVPGMGDLLDGTFQVRIRDVDINDLLRRESVALDSEAITEMIRGRTVMVTGAGGSIGSEICREVAECGPAKLLLVERAENNLFNIDRELRRLSTTSVVPLLADISDAQRMQGLFRQYRPEIVFHAAAHKHVPLMEMNPGQAVANNVLGTKAIADLAAEFEAERFVLISTDKAVNPSSVMGATKQLAERYVHASSEISNTKFVVVRFGNVLASSGSVVPVFQEQIRRGGPVTVTDPNMERYFMTIPEACQLVLQSAALGRGGEIFVLDMGSPVRILDLARDLIYLSGLSTKEIKIEIVGRRPGEKETEELYQCDEEMLETTHPRINAAYHRTVSKSEIDAMIEQLESVVNQPPVTVKAKLSELVHEYASEPEPEDVSPRAEPDAPARVMAF